EALSTAGIELDQVDLPPFQLVKEDWRAIHQFLVTWHCLVMGWIGDLYHFSYRDTPPLLPKLLPDLLNPDFPPEVAHAFIDHYCRSYRAVAAEQPAWAPELALQLAVPLAALANRAWAVREIIHAIQIWLAQRGLPTIAGTGIAVIDCFCAQVGAADGPVSPAVLVDPGFLTGLRDAIGSLNQSDLMARLGGATSAAAARQEREQIEQKRQERQERERLEQERQERKHQQRLEQERQERVRLEQEQQERERLELERQNRERQQRLKRENQRIQADRWAAKVPPDIHGWSSEQVQGLQRSVAASMGLAPVFRDPFKDGSNGPEMVLIPPGSFLMGASDGDDAARDNEKPQHRVIIARPFAIGCYAVTFDEYDGFCAVSGHEKPADNSSGRGRGPVINISWDDSVAYCVWVSEQTGRHYRLPTEAEWEYAARAGTTTRWSFGSDEKTLRDHASFRGNFFFHICGTDPVGTKRPNPWGLFDVHGNVWEWVQDSWHDNYTSAPVDGSEWRESGHFARRVSRGGSWNSDRHWVRVSTRNGYDPAYGNNTLGLRLAQDL
ncbi:SUMF1/EgtB/PvdO family nonheme iron enzyme, partial [uncultured Thiodictyon sp.]|uniref:formylglycine-generating enzyme family protein n=1 Tax=uncultured Thiodictyon sp. TaxID=1846217 RepID=UPI0025E48517